MQRRGPDEGCRRGLQARVAEEGSRARFRRIADCCSGGDGASGGVGWGTARDAVDTLNSESGIERNTAQCNGVLAQRWDAVAAVPVLLGGICPPKQLAGANTTDKLSSYY